MSALPSEGLKLVVLNVWSPDPQQEPPWELVQILTLTPGPLNQKLWVGPGNRPSR